jgi:hypothetical protein
MLGPLNKSLAAPARAAAGLRTPARAPAFVNRSRSSRLSRRRRAAAAEDDNANNNAADNSDLPPTDGDYWAAALWGSDDDGADGPAYASPMAGTTTSAFSTSFQTTTTAPMTADELKRALLDSFYGTERGLSAGIEARAEIAELIAQLEAAKPPPEDPAQALELLNGEWRLAYTSGSELLAVLALSRLPLVSVGDVTQTIDSSKKTFENAAEVSALSGAAGTTKLTARASFEALSARRIAVRFESGGATAPKLSGALPFFDDGFLPSSVSLAGQAVDLSPLRPALAPLEEGARAALALAGNLLASAPDLEVPVPSGGAAGAAAGLTSLFGGGGSSSSSGSRTWLVTTYLDEDLRISKGDGGGVFVLQKVAGGGGEDEWRSGGGNLAAAEAAAAEVVLEESAEVVVGADAASEAWSRTDPASSTR